MNVKEAYEQMKRHEADPFNSYACYCSCEGLSTYCYRAKGFLECWEKMKPVGEAFEILINCMTDAVDMDESKNRQCIDNVCAVHYIEAKKALKTIREIEGE